MVVLVVEEEEVDLEVIPDVMDQTTLAVVVEQD
jgi:hypothetical protein